MITQESYMTVVGLADHWRVCEDTIYKLLRNGDIEAFKVGGQWRIPQTSIKKYSVYPIDDPKLPETS
tara:strand:+ start:2687 stop:2887 length:201 start_codon:yes stop_codon:yes gene_type:complete